MNLDKPAFQKVREDRLLIDAVDRWLFVEMEPYLGQRVLEIGCGLGNFARHLTDRELYVGTETSAEISAVVQEQFADASTLRFDVADSTGAAFREEGALISAPSYRSTCSSTWRITRRPAPTAPRSCGLAGGSSSSFPRICGSTAPSIGRSATTGTTTSR